MAIYLTGDTHGSVDVNKLSNSNLKSLNVKMGEGDYLIICGDFGFPFLDPERDPHPGEYQYWCEWLSGKPYTILWVDGNHENFDFWGRQPITTWNGGKVQMHPHIKNCIHLMRGEYYVIDGRTFFTFGGALSMDKQYRQPGYSWWEQEEAVPEEMQHAREVLQAHEHRADFIITHTLPQSLIGQVNMLKDVPDRTAQFLDEVYETVSYQHWYCGHFHVRRELMGQRISVLYEDIIPLENEELY
jgi:hypothetical protein